MSHYTILLQYRPVNIYNVQCHVQCKLYVITYMYMSGHMFTGLYEIWPPHCLQVNVNMKTYQGLTNNITVMSSTRYSCF